MIRRSVSRPVHMSYSSAAWKGTMALQAATTRFGENRESGATARSRIASATESANS
jgi:hypothetical protein